MKAPKDLGEWLRDIFYSKGITKPPENEQIFKIGFWEDSEGNIRYIKFYNKELELLFTLEFSNAGEATSETWNITRN